MSGVDSMETDHQSLESCLFVAVNNGDEAKVRELLSNKNIDVHSKIESPLTCIHVAVEKGLLNICEHLVKSGADVNSRFPTAEDRYVGSTLLYRAASKGDAAVVELLLKYGADVDARNTDGSTSLHIAAEKGFLQIVKTLTEKGANVNSKHIPNDTVDHYRMKFLENKLIRGILKLGTVEVSNISVYEGEFTPLHVAVKKGHEKIVKLLLESGACVDTADDNGETPLSLAALKGCPLMLDHVLNHFPDKNLVANRRALARAVKFKGEIYQNIILKLLDYGLLYDDKLFKHDYLHSICSKKPPWPVPPYEQRTFPDIAAENGHFSVVRWLLKDHPASQLDVKSCASKCLAVSIDSGSEDDIKFLLSCGADVNYSNYNYNFLSDLRDQNSQLMQAVRKSNVRIAKLLIKSGAAITQNPWLLITATDSGCLEMVKLLLRCGAKVNESWRVGNPKLQSVPHWRRYSSLRELDINFAIEVVSPLFIAASNGHEDMVKFLLENGAATEQKTSVDHNCLTPFLVSVVCGHLEIAELLLKSGAKINSCDASDRTALHIAAELGHKDVIIKLLLRFGANIETVVSGSKRGDFLTPLLFAAKEGHLGSVKTLLDLGARVDFSLRGSITALGLAAENGHAAIVKTLLEQGASLNYKFRDGKTALFYAIEGGHIKTVETLLEYGANIHIIDNNLEHPFQIACRKQNDKIMDLLISYGAGFKEVDLYEKKTLLRAVSAGDLKTVEAYIKERDSSDLPVLGSDALLGIAVENDHIEIALLLSDHGILFNSDEDCDRYFLMSAERERWEAVDYLNGYGASIDCCDSNGLTVLHFAAKCNNAYFMEQLLEFNGDVDLNAVTKKGETPLILSAKAGFLNTVDFLILCGVNLEIADHHGRTALFFAAEWGHADVLRLLIDKGADVNCRAKNGETLLLIAAKRGNFDILELLLKYGANVNASNTYCETALYFAAEHGKANAVKLLLGNGANVNAATKTGKTPVAKSAKRGRLEIVDILLNFGALVNYTDRDGTTPLLFAVSHGHADVVKLLLEHGADVCRHTRSNDLPLLLIAARLKSSKIVRVLLDFGVTFELFDGHKMSLPSHFPRLLAAWQNRDTFPLLLLYGFGDNKSVSETTVQVLFYVLRIVYQRDRRSRDCRLSAKTLERFYVQMKAAGIFNDLNIDHVEPFTFRRTHKYYEIECKQELEVMRGEFVNGFDSDVTLYDILTGNLSRLASIARNPRLISFFAAQHRRDRFPIYHYIIRCQIAKGMLKRELLDECLRVFLPSCEALRSVPVDICERILLYLKNQDLRVLITAAKNVHH